MTLDSYKLSRKYSYSQPHKEMLREKRLQVNALYNQAPDREDDTLLNGKPFIKSPRIFDRKFVDTVHHKVTVITVEEDDWIECGDYLEYDGMMWLCLNSFSFHGLYCKATFMSCDWEIYWCNQEGEIQHIWCIDQNSTQYNSGEKENKLMTLGSAQHMLRVQCTKETVMFDSPMRFFLDKNIINPTCYMVTQNDNTSYNYGKGLCCITVLQCESDGNLDKKVTLDNGKEVWIADYVQKEEINDDDIPNVPTDSNIISVIDGRSDLKIGYKRKYIVTFTDKDGNDIDDSTINYSWNINALFKEELAINIVGNTIELTVNNDSLIGESFLLQVLIDDTVSTEMLISIKGMF